MPASYHHPDEDDPPINVAELNQRFHDCPHKIKTLVAIIGDDLDIGDVLQRSRNLFEMDATREEMCTFENYQVTDEEWELVKANFAYQAQPDNPPKEAYSKEYIINALARFTEYVAEQDQGSAVFEKSVTYSQPRRARKDVFLKYLNLLREFLPKWYNLPPMLADSFKSRLKYGILMDVIMRSNGEYQEQYGVNPKDLRHSELREHPYKWLKAIHHFLEGGYACSNADNYELCRTSTEARLELSVEQYCYLGSDEWMRTIFYDDIDPHVNEAVVAMFNDLEQNPEVDPDAEGFSPENAERGITAIENLIATDNVTPRDEIVDSLYLAKLRWLFCATKRKLSRYAQLVVLHLLWQEASEMNGDNHSPLEHLLNLEKPVRHHQDFIELCRVIRDYGTFAGFTSQCLPINIETAIFQPPSNADALLDLESLRVLKGLADDDAPFLQMRGLIENTANELPPLQEKLTLEAIGNIIILGKWFTVEVGATLGQTFQTVRIQKRGSHRANHP